MPTASPDKSDTYEVKIVLTSKSHPNRWMSLVVQDALNEGEEIIHISVREVDNV